jgi:hypothetical protein
LQRQQVLLLHFPVGAVACQRNVSCEEGVVQ